MTMRSVAFSEKKQNFYMAADYQKLPESLSVNAC